jgi:hypothetical protein
LPEGVLVTPVGKLPPLREIVAPSDAIYIIAVIDDVPVFWVTVWLAVPLYSIMVGLEFTVMVAGADTALTQPLELANCTVYVVVSFNV